MRISSGDDREDKCFVKSEMFTVFKTIKYMYKVFKCCKSAFFISNVGKQLPYPGSPLIFLTSKLFEVLCPHGREA